MATLLIGEVANGRLTDLVARALTAAAEISQPVDILVAGKDVGGAAAHPGRHRRRAGSRNEET